MGGSPSSPPKAAAVSVGNRKRCARWNTSKLSTTTKSVFIGPRDCEMQKSKINSMLWAICGSKKGLVIEIRQVASSCPITFKRDGGHIQMSFFLM
jgi:hypothetical protein